MEKEGDRMITETFFVETYSGAKCHIKLEVIAKKGERVLVKGWNCYKELVQTINGRNFWVVDQEYKEIPEEWKDLVKGEEDVKVNLCSTVSSKT